MAGTVNKVILVGHTGDEVKMKYFDGGNCIGRFPLATNEDYVNRSTGERISNTEWHNCVVRNKAAEVCEKYLHKGDKVYIEGRIKSRQWTTENGEQRYTTEIQVQEFTFLSAKSTAPKETSNQPAKQQDQKNPTTAARPTQVNEPSPTPVEDDLPF